MDIITRIILIVIIVITCISCENSDVDIYPNGESSVTTEEKYYKTSDALTAFYEAGYFDVWSSSKVELEDCNEVAALRIIIWHSGDGGVSSDDSYPESEECAVYVLEYPLRSMYLYGYNLNCDKWIYAPVAIHKNLLLVQHTGHVYETEILEIFHKIR